jgi:tRNA G18 (ribose-2'-O)-methylase SpoU
MEDPIARADVTTYPSCSDEWRRLLQIPAAVKREDAGDATINVTSTPFGPADTQRKIETPALRESARRTRTPLVVVATVVDLSVNLAGLSRTSEIFNCEALCMASKQILKDSSFQTVSVNAEKWLPIREVPRKSLRESLSELKRRGFSLVGVEQTHDSVLIDDWKFAEKTALVLGNEKEGIDADILPLLDGCVEIPQSGQLRSLNVHASGCIAIWEYVRQQRQGTPS